MVCTHDGVKTSSGLLLMRMRYIGSVGTLLGHGIIQRRFPSMGTNRCPAVLVCVKVRSAVICVWLPVMVTNHHMVPALLVVLLSCTASQSRFSLPPLTFSMAMRAAMNAPTLICVPSMSAVPLMENISCLFSLFSMLELKVMMGLVLRLVGGCWVGPRRDLVPRGSPLAAERGVASVLAGSLGPLRHVRCY